MNVSYALNGKSVAVNPHPVKLQKGLNEVRIDFTIGNPSLWWPNGLGDHPLYDFTGVTNFGDTLKSTGLKRIQD